MLKKIPQILFSRGTDLLNRDQFENAMSIFELYPEDPKCQVRIAEIIYRDDVRPDAERRSFELLQKAAENDYVDAFFHLAYFYESGIGVDSSLEKAKCWYRKCIDLKSPNALLKLGDIRTIGRNGQTDWVQTYRYFYLSYLVTGSSRSMEMMNDALHCMTKTQHEQALSLADDWIDSKYKLQIRGLDQDVTQVIQSDEDFKFVTGNCETLLTFLQVKHILELIKDAKFDAATEGLEAFISDPLGQFLLGLINYQDQDRHSGLQNALPYFKSAAEQGCTLAFFRLGYCYAQGAGTEINIPEANNWYTKAAELGDSKAQHNLAQLHYRCVEMPREYIRAYKWFFMSLAHGCHDAERHSISLFNKLSPAEQEEALSAVESCVEKIYETPEEQRHPDHRRFFPAPNKSKL